MFPRWAAQHNSQDDDERRYIRSYIYAYILGYHTANFDTYLSVARQRCWHALGKVGYARCLGELCNSCKSSFFHLFFFKLDLFFFSAHVASVSTCGLRSKAFLCLESWKWPLSVTKVHSIFQVHPSDFLFPFFSGNAE